MARILVIEDDETLRIAAGRALGRQGHDVRLAHDGLAGVEEATKGDYDLIVCDYEMPGLNGHQVYERLPERYRERFLMWTASEVSSPSGALVPKGGPASELVEAAGSLLSDAP